MPGPEQGSKHAENLNGQMTETDTQLAAIRSRAPEVHSGVREPVKGVVNVTEVPRRLSEGGFNS